MRTQKRIFAVSVGVMLFAAVACKFSASTANISSLRVSKDKSASQETSTFGAEDPVYAVATVSNAPGKVKVKGRLVIEDVSGQTAGPVPGLENTVELPGSGTATFTFTPPPTGWPRGKYKIEAIMMNEEGEQKDQKSSSFTVF